MSRNHERLRVFHDAHSLTIAIYRYSHDFPRDEWFGLRSQMRRAAVSIACNIVEGSARESTREYLRFLNIALGSSNELDYLLSLALELHLTSADEWKALQPRCKSVSRQLQRLVDRLATDPERLNQLHQSSDSC